jgi:hypothetical protein
VRRAALRGPRRALGPRGARREGGLRARRRAGVPISRSVSVRRLGCSASSSAPRARSRAEIRVARSRSRDSSSRTRAVRVGAVTTTIGVGVVAPGPSLDGARGVSAGDGAREASQLAPARVATTTDECRPAQAASPLEPAGRRREARARGWLRSDLSHGTGVLWGQVPRGASKPRRAKARRGRKRGSGAAVRSCITSAYTQATRQVASDGAPPDLGGAGGGWCGIEPAARRIDPTSARALRRARRLSPDERPALVDRDVRHRHRRRARGRGDAHVGPVVRRVPRAARRDAELHFLSIV